MWVVLDEHIEGEIGYPKLIGHKPSISTVLQRKVFGCQYVAGFDGNGPTLPKCCLQILWVSVVTKRGVQQIDSPPVTLYIFTDG